MFNDCSPELKSFMKFGLLVTAIIIMMVIIIAGVSPIYGVWQQGMSGKAELRRAEQNRQIAVQEAQAKRESAKELAQAEIERAKGVAEANRIIGDSLKGNADYLHYLWIHALEETAAQGDKVIYIPTEANLPVVEAGRLGVPKAERNPK